MELTLYGLEQCDTCKKARNYLEKHQIAHRFVDYRAQPLSPAKLRQFASKIGWEQLVNRASLTWRNLPDARKSPSSEADWLALVAEFPALIKRPLAVADDVVLAGFSENQYRLHFG